jgi:uncharacterized protein YaiI (UPF0178 family)
MDDIPDAAPRVPAIYLDADACPVKAETYRVAQRYAMKVHVVANDYLAVPNDPLFERVVVGKGFDAVDDWIAGRVGPGDIVVTADILLAGRSVKAGAAALSPTGRRFTESSVGNAVADRNLMTHLRESGAITSGPRPMSPRDRSAFLQALDETIVRLRRAAAR